jgi:ribonuclease J
MLNNTNNKRPVRSPRRGLKPNPYKTTASPVSNTHFAVRRPVRNFDDSAPSSNFRSNKSRNKNQVALLAGGNLSNPNINPHFFSGPKIKTNSPEFFTDGQVVKIIPLGGASEVGMNMTVLECGEDIVIVDTGMGFGGGDKFPGVDYIIPDTEYLEQNRHKIRGLIYTHAHLDHIGAAPYVIPKIGSIPIFGMPLTLALLKNRLQEFELADKLVAKVINLDMPLTLGNFKFNFFRLNHSIPDVVGLAIDTPMGRIMYCTDWKFDNTPFDGQLSDYGKLAKYGDEGVRLLLTDSLGILKPGYQISEKAIGKEIMRIFASLEGRVIVTSFSTTISRLQFTIDSCEKFGRKMVLLGRSMVTNFKTCYELGYLKVPAGIVIDMNEANKLPPEKVCVLSTGSQGEDMAALSRMARDEHQQIKLQGGDAVIFTSNPIPGNEDAVQDLISKLSRKGVETYRNKDFPLHVSGHACHEDIKLLIALTRPDYLQPIHGDHFMLKRVGELGASMGIPFEHNLIGENGRVIELRTDKVVLTENIVTDKIVLVDGMSVGKVSEAVLIERRQMATDGMMNIVILINKRKELLTSPEIVSRGFVYIKNSTEFIDGIKELTRERFMNSNIDKTSKTYFSDLRKYISEQIGNHIYKIAEKNPMIIPIIVQT